MENKKNLASYCVRQHNTQLTRSAFKVIIEESGLEYKMKAFKKRFGVT